MLNSRFSVCVIHLNYHLMLEGQTRYYGLYHLLTELTSQLEIPYKFNCFACFFLSFMVLLGPPICLQWKALLIINHKSKDSQMSLLF